MLTSQSRWIEKIYLARTHLKNAFGLQTADFCKTACSGLNVLSVRIVPAAAVLRRNPFVFAYKAIFEIGSSGLVAVMLALAPGLAWAQINSSGSLTTLLADKEALNSPSILVLDVKANKVLAERGAEIKRPIASLTKLMTALVFLDYNPGWNKRVTIQKRDYAIGATVPIKAGDVVTTRDLFYAMFIRSANNATHALARSTGLSESAFVAKMNAKARRLGLNHTRFVEPTGLEAGNQATAEDFIKLARQALKNSFIAQASIARQHSLKLINRGRRVFITNPNKILKDSHFTILGTKTGFTYEAGRNLLVRAKNKQGQDIMIVTLGADKTGAHWQDMTTLLEATLGAKRIASN